MSTVPHVRRPVKPVSGTCMLVLEINGIAYGVTFLQPHREVAARAIRLHKSTGDSYDLAVTEHGADAAARTSCSAGPIRTRTAASTSSLPVLAVCYSRRVFIRRSAIGPFP